jgi:hypothetical protein
MIYNLKKSEASPAIQHMGIKMLKVLFLCFCSTIAIFIVGCISYSSTGVFSSGKDTYTVVVSGKGKPWFVDLQRMAYQEANNFCQRKGMVFQPVVTKAVPASNDVDSFFELQFRTISPDDPDYLKPDFKPLSDLQPYIEIVETEQ